MKTKLAALKILFILSAFLFPVRLLAQQDVEGLFKSGPEDATKLINAYMNPLFKGLGVGLNSGWNTTAKSKGFLRFDLRITATAAFVPTADRTYDVNTLGLQNIKPATPGGPSTGPTAFGNDSKGANMEIYSNGIATTQTFKLPQGSGIHFVPSPQIQLTMGLPKNIDVSLRYVPKIKLGSDAGKIDLFGAGAKVELFPLIMGKAQKIMPFDIAVALGFTRLNYSLPLHVNTNAQNSNQELDIRVNGFNSEAIISKKLLFFTPFASVGYNSSSSSLKALGNYEFSTPTTLNPNQTTTYTDPISIKDNLDGFRAAVGFQLNLAFFRIYGSYTAAKYDYVNAGIGFSFGK